MKHEPSALYTKSTGRYLKRNSNRGNGHSRMNNLGRSKNRGSNYRNHYNSQRSKNVKCWNYGKIGHYKN